MVDAMDFDRFFTGRFLPEFVQDVSERNPIELMLDAVGNGLPDRLGFADRLPWTVVGLVAEADHEAHAIVKECNHLTQADFINAFEQTDTAICTDDSVCNAMAFEFSVDVFNYFVADIDPFCQCCDGKRCFYLVQFVNQPDGVAGIGGKDHRAM